MTGAPHLHLAGAAAPHPAAPDAWRGLCSGHRSCASLALPRLCGVYKLLEAQTLQRPPDVCISGHGLKLGTMARAFPPPPH